MKEHEAIGTAWMRVGKRANWTVVLTYAALLMLVRDGQTRMVKHSEIADTAGIGSRSVARAMNVLKSLGLIQRQRIGRRTAEYTHARNVPS